MIKKIFVLSVIALGSALFFWAVYNLAFNKKHKTENTDENVITKEKNSDIFSDLKRSEEKGFIRAVSDEGAIRAAYVKNTEKIIFYATNGKVWDVEIETSAKNNISDKELPDLQDVRWSPDGTQVITTFNAKNKLEFYNYNYQNGKGTKLKDNLDSVVWDSIGAKIIYKYFDPKTKERTLNISNPDGTSWKKLTDLSFKDVVIEPVPQSSLVSFWNAPKSSEETTMQLIGTEGGDVQKIFGGKFGVDYLWSPNGQVALVSSLNEKNGKQLTLGVIERNGTYVDLKIPTFASKCVWSADNRTVFYSLPGNIPENSMIPEDYMSRKFYTADTFWKVDVTTGKNERIVDLNNMDGKYDASKMFLSANEDALFFINRVDRKIYYIKL